jgi:hypothetical protein
MRQLPSVTPFDRFARHKDAFWQTVRDSLVEIHGLPLREAVQRVTYVRQRGMSLSGTDDDSGDLIYHAEPFDVACDMAGEDRRWEDYKELYAQIVARHDVADDGGAPARGRQGPYLPS